MSDEATTDPDFVVVGGVRVKVYRPPHPVPPEKEDEFKARLTKSLERAKFVVHREVTCADPLTGKPARIDFIALPPPAWAGRRYGINCLGIEAKASNRSWHDIVEGLSQSEAYMRCYAFAKGDTHKSKILLPRPDVVLIAVPTLLGSDTTRDDDLQISDEIIRRSVPDADRSSVVHGFSQAVDRAAWKKGCAVLRATDTLVGFRCNAGDRVERSYVLWHIAKDKDGKVIQ